MQNPGISCHIDTLIKNKKISDQQLDSDSPLCSLRPEEVFQMEKDAACLIFTA